MKLFAYGYALLIMIFARMKAAAAEEATVRDLMRDIDRTLLRENLNLSVRRTRSKASACIAIRGRTEAGTSRG